MNTETNELVHPETEALSDLLEELDGTRDAAEDLERAERKMEALKARGFQELPPEFDHAARCALQGRPRTTVSFKSKGKLSRWAARARRDRRS